jgi:hypothetical protein
VTSFSEELKTRLQRIRTLVHRLTHVRNSAIEAELITQLTLETEAVRRARAAAAASPPPAEQPATPARPTHIRVARPLTSIRPRVRAVRRSRAKADIR